MAIAAGTTTQGAGQAHLATVYYNRVGLDTLQPKFRFYEAATKFTQPSGNGKTMQMWRDGVATYNTTPASEGVTVDTPYVNSSSTLTATVERYSDSMSTSQMMEDTSITDEKERLIRALTTRAAGSVDTIIRAELDSYSADATVFFDAIGTSVVLVAGDFKKHGALMAGANVDPFDGTRNLAVIHPYLVYDLTADNTAGGFIDSLKYQNGTKVLNGEVGEIGNTRLLTSTNVGNDGVAATSTKYYNYIFGYQALGVVELAGRGPDNIVDPKKQNFKIELFPGGGAWDPTHEIGTVAGYNYVMAAKVLDKTRFHVVKADSTIV